MRYSLLLVLLCAVLLAGCKESTVDPGTEESGKSEELYYTLIDGNQSIGIFAINTDGANRRMILEQGVLFNAPESGRLVALKPPVGMVTCTLTGAVLHTFGLVPQDTFFNPALSPAGDKVAYSKTYSTTTATVTEIHVVDTDGTNHVMIEADAAYETIPVWSPDGTKVAYFKQGVETGGIDRDSLFIINNDGTGRRFLTNEGMSFNDYLEGLDWSPDGTRLVCITETAPQQYEVMVVNVAGGETQVVTSDRVPKLMPAWSPDSKKIVYVTDEQANYGALYIIDADGTNMRLHVMSTVNTVVNPQWSPKGGYITVSEINGSEGGKLKLLNVNSGIIRTLDNEVYKAFWKK